MKLPEFYVYHLVDPRTGDVFYVGKGKGRRAWMHERAVVRGRVSNEAKTEVVRSILADGLSVSVRIESFHQHEEDAYKAESASINSIGVDNLTNLNIGGSGGRSAWRGPVITSDMTIGHARKRLIDVASGGIALRLLSELPRCGSMWMEKTGLSVELLEHIREGLVQVAKDAIAVLGADKAKGYARRY